MNPILASLPLRSFLREAVRNVKSRFGDEGAKYDYLAFKVMKRIIQRDDNCLDIGCHKGVYLDQILRLAPHGTHAVFEPIPELCEFLRTRYAQYPNVAIHELALSTFSGETEFQFNKTHPGWSGLKRRSYPSEEDEVQALCVRVQSLNQILPRDMRIDFVKIDVEGAELDVLRGGIQVLSRNRPLIIFEYGLGSSEMYGAQPASMFELIEQLGLYISSIEKYLHGTKPMTRSEFIDCYLDHTSYYFVAYTDVHIDRMRAGAMRLGTGLSLVKSAGNAETSRGPRIFICPRSSSRAELRSIPVIALRP